MSYGAFGTLPGLSGSFPGFTLATSTIDGLLQAFSYGVLPAGSSWALTRGGGVVLHHSMALPGLVALAPVLRPGRRMVASI